VCAVNQLREQGNSVRGFGFESLVAFNSPDTVARDGNQSIRQTPADSLRASGTGITDRTTTISKRAMGGVRRRKAFTNAEIREFYYKHRNHIEFAERLVYSAEFDELAYASLRCPNTAATITRARICRVTRGVCEEFVEILRGNYKKSSEVASSIYAAIKRFQVWYETVKDSRDCTYCLLDKAMGCFVADTKMPAAPKRPMGTRDMGMTVVRGASMKLKHRVPTATAVKYFDLTGEDGFATYPEAFISSELPYFP